MNSFFNMIDVGVIAYSFCALANSIFLLLLLTSWNERRKGIFIVAAVAVNVIWAFCLATIFRGPTTPFWTIHAIELLKYAAWTIFLAIVLRGSNKILLFQFSLSFSNAVYLILLLNVGAIAVSFVSPSPELLSGVISSVTAVTLLGLALCGLVMIEQIYRNIRAEKRWAIKFLCVGLGAIFAYDIYMYAETLMFHRVNMLLWDARGFIDAMAVPLLAVSIARDPRFSINIFVSRQVVFYSSVLTGVGIYFLFMALGGYYLRQFGGTWGGLAQIVFIFGAALLLVIIMLSGNARNSVKVFLVKHFFSNKYDYRIEWLKLVNTLSIENESEDLQQRAIKSLANIVAADGGCLWVLNGQDTYTLESYWNVARPNVVEESVNSMFIKRLQEKQWIIDMDSEASLEEFVIPDWLSDLRARGAWLLVPLINANTLFGFIVLEGGNQRVRLDWEDTDFLKTVGRQITSYIALDRAAEELSHAKQFDAYNKLAAFIIHDIKNLVSQLSLITQNAAQHKDNPLFLQDAMDTVENSVIKMKELLSKLQQRRAREIDVSKFSLRKLLEEVVQECSQRKPVPEVTFPTDDICIEVERMRLSMSMRHLVANAQDATNLDGKVLINVQIRHGFVEISVEDNGCGMSEEFIRTRFYKPFDTTKSSKGMGIGVYEVKEFVQSIGGVINVSSSKGEGTVVTIGFPVKPEFDGFSIAEEADCG